MRFPLSWLKRYLDTEASATDLADAMTRLGLEVESLENPAEALKPFVIAKVLTAERHPQADKLQVLSVDTGDGKGLQVVCGAPNARAGLLGVFGSPGAYVPGLDVTLKVAAIRGVESNGMMCSARELQLGEDHEGILDLPADAPVGAGYAEWAGLNDPVFEVAITPNRQDCMGVYGIARDLAAAGLGTLKPLVVPAIAAQGESLVPVRTDDPKGCPAFFARSVAGVRNGPSPKWLQDILTRAGLRPISALVDVTNYFAIGLGRPLHVYDVAKLKGGLVARRAKPGETLLALNGKSYELDDSMTVIADDTHVHDIGGIMGGMDSGVSETTTDVLVEAAYFDPARIGATGRALGLTSDARSRFERGVDPAFVEPGLDLAVAMIVELCGGTASEILKAGEPPLAEKTVGFDPARTLALGGLDVPEAEQRAILEKLGFVVAEGAAPWAVAVPSWRRDVDGAADLVEEIVRLHGLDKVRSVALPRPDGVAAPTATPAQKLERRLKRLMAARGLDEAITWSFISEAEAAKFGGCHWKLDNPLSAELAVMRGSLLPGLVSAAGRNAARGSQSLRLFQHGRRYLAEGERPTLAVLLAGDATPRDWRFGKARAFDAFDAKAEVQAALAAAGAPVERLQTVQPASDHYHPGRSAKLVLGKAVLAEFGELHPDVLGDLDRAVAAEIFLDAIPERRQKRARPAFTPPALQPVRRDFAFLVPETVQAEALVRAVKGADKALIADAQLFDRFAGAGVPEGQLSLAVAVTLQPLDKTLTDADIEAVARAIVAAAGKLGATLRG
ncbi:phenylalanine--tRNA ligase subunit beta [Sandaracinobacter sp. RS1-74]|uniref:phenylalanine--tRNA ligase subunit beta n=1 Tax=Sandaracinobacteroides sayramensis TaxID=2913411 RepID=UPI001EDC899C|nr:phenylalanine--tRNA ligase subunit beta [Sandaracinobacteroides sayramensis]MCG2839364.1 phenylalanine--tRNA ligase subunit beta [Sandaracinobacteroides sayramensis]